MIDIVLVCVGGFLTGPLIGGMLGAVAGGALGAGGDQSQGAAMAMGGIIGAIIGAMVAIVLIGTIYNLIEGFTGWTFGKLILGIQVANADGTRASAGTLLERYALKNISFLLQLAAVFSGIRALSTLGNLGGLAIFVGCFFVIGTAHQAFHDMLAKTAVYPRSMIHA